MDGGDRGEAQMCRVMVSISELPGVVARLVAVAARKERMGGSSNQE